jgi:beta-phosphoglucomutase-like phosphatase (HAD superfamily)
MSIKAVILDFDGVILESCDIKTWAFGELFKEHPEYVDEIVEYHKKNGGVSRYKKFAYFYEELLKRPATDAEIEDLGERFSQLVFDEIKRCDPVPGAFEFLEDFSNRIMLFVASGTPDDELKAIVKGRGLDRYFQGVYGTPDSETDYEGAIEVGVPFIARITDPITFSPKREDCLGIVEDMNGLTEILRGKI